MEPDEPKAQWRTPHLGVIRQQGVDQIPVVIGSVDRTLRIRCAYRAACRLYGYTAPPEILGRWLAGSGSPTRPAGSVGPRSLLSPSKSLSPWTRMFTQASTPIDAPNTRLASKARHAVRSISTISPRPRPVGTGMGIVAMPAPAATGPAARPMPSGICARCAGACALSSKCATDSARSS